MMRNSEIASSSPLLSLCSNLESLALDAKKGKNKKKNKKKSNEKRSNDSSSSSPNLESGSDGYAPWLDLPNPLTEKILERLPISDYIRFGAVCPQWRSIQRDHRCRHASRPPTMVNLPWFITKRPDQESVVCSSPFPDEDQRSHRLRIPLTPRYLKYQSDIRDLRSWGAYCQTNSCAFSFPNGWLLLDDCPSGGSGKSWYFTLLNPISGVQIQLPPCGMGLDFESKPVAVSPPPNCAVLAFTYDKWNKYMRLFHHHDWQDLFFPDEDKKRNNYSNGSMRWDGIPFEVVSGIFWRGKFYCIYLSRGLIVVDPMVSEPAACFLEMDQSQLPVLENRWEDRDKMELFLLESNGELLLVVEFFQYDPTHTTRGLVGFQVFQADFSEKTWVRVENIGDRVLLIYRNLAVSLLAADIGVKGNCIYCIDPSKKEPKPWSIFDLGTGRVTDASLTCPPLPSTHLMFVPTIN